MNPAHKRIAEMASGWEGSRAEITVSPADARILEGVGAKLNRGRRDTDPVTISAPDLCAAAEELLLEGIRNELGIEKEEAAAKPPEDDGLDKKTVPELRAVAANAGLVVPGDTKKADIIEAIRKAHAQK